MTTMLTDTKELEKLAIQGLQASSDSTGKATIAKVINVLVAEVRSRDEQLEQVAVHGKRIDAALLELEAFVSGDQAKPLAAIVANLRAATAPWSAKS